MSETAFRSATALAGAIRMREIGARELLENYINRIERHNPALNAMIAINLDEARRRADHADAALARGENWGALL
jgi:amidase